MSEQMTHPSPEHGEKQQKSPEHQHHVERSEHHKDQAEHAEKQKPLHELQQSAKEQAVSVEHTSVGEKHQAPATPILGMQRELKSNAYKQTLKKVRTHLSPAEKTLSKLVHQPVVETVSEAGAKTVARPSGILGGGIVALLGSGAVLYMSKHYGFRYNFFVFVVLFIGGFALGMLAELTLRLFVRKRASS